MDARRSVKDADSAGDRNAELEAHGRVDEAKRALGERPRVVGRRCARFQLTHREEHAIRRLVLKAAIGLITARLVGPCCGAIVGNRAASS